MKKMMFVLFLLVLGVAGIFAFDKGQNEISSIAAYEVLQKWELPEELNEISGIDWLGDNKVAAIQDEDGIIFIYDLKSSRIVNKIPFGGNGDYEGIRISGSDAYVLRSDGLVYKIANFLKDKPEVTEHQTSLSGVKKIDVEGLGFDSKNSRLLLAEKERQGNNSSKGIYEVALNTSNSPENPVFSIELEDPIFTKVNGKKEDRFWPSEISLDPTKESYYLLDGRNPKLLIVDTNGKPQHLVLFKKQDFEQPEGLTFDPQGNLYISNEAGDGPANILQVSVKKFVN